jgi:hypothetical protein
MTNPKNKIQDLVVFSNAHLTDSLQNLAENIHICKGSKCINLNEDKFKNLPYKIKINEPEDEDLQFVIKFIRDTIGFLNLKNNEIELIALAASLERKKQKKLDHLNNKQR